MYTVYMLICKDRKGNESLYTGYTKHLLTRFNQHKNGKGARYTIGKDLTIGYHSSPFMTIREAMAEERRIKGLSSQKRWEMVEKNVGM